MNGIRLLSTSLAAVLVATIATGALASEPVDCFYAARATKRNLRSEITRHRRCASVRRDGSIRILPQHLRALEFNSDGLATLVLANGGWFYVDHDGESLAVLAYDNGPDSFAEGLVRGRRNGKIAFFDRSFRMVVAPRYDFAWPFEGGLAAVCSGCKEESAAPDPEHHTALTGGRWGYIDHRGREVIEVKFSREEASRRKEQPRR